MLSYLRFERAIPFIKGPSIAPATKQNSVLLVTQYCAPNIHNTLDEWGNIDGGDRRVNINPQQLSRPLP